MGKLFAGHFQRNSRRTRSNRHRGAGLFALLLIFPFAALAQSTGGSLSGKITDDANTRLRGVVVTATHVATGSSRVAKTAADGRYRFYSLATGIYELVTEMPGHIGVTVRKIEVALGTTTRVDVQMQRSSEDEQKTVTAQARFLESTAAIGAVVPRELVISVPLRDRDATELVSVAPFSHITSIGEVMINGASAATDIALDAVEQLNITTRQHPAEYGRSNGGVLRVASRVGEYEYEGDAFTLFRNNGEGVQWGIAGGGPIIKERSHFFTAVDGGSEIAERVFAGVDGDVSAKHFVHADYRMSRGSEHDQSGLVRDLWHVRGNLWNDLVLQGASGANEIRESLAGTAMAGATRHDWTAGAMTQQHNGRAFFVQDEVVARKFSVTAGLRYDDEFSPRIGIVYDVNGSGRNLMRASYGDYADRTDASLGYSWQINPWVALNADALHTRPAGGEKLEALAIGGRVQFSNTVSVVGSYTFANVKAGRELTPRHFFEAAGIVRLPAGFWLSGIGGHRSATAGRDRETEIDLRVAKTFEWGKGYTLDLMIDGFDVFRRGDPSRQPAEQVGVRVNF